VYCMILQMFLASDLRFLFKKQFRDLVFPNLFKSTYHLRLQFYFTAITFYYFQLYIHIMITFMINHFPFYGGFKRISAFTIVTVHFTLLNIHLCTRKCKIKINHMFCQHRAFVLYLRFSEYRVISFLSCTDRP